MAMAAIVIQTEEYVDISTCKTKDYKARYSWEMKSKICLLLSTRVAQFPSLVSE